MKRKKFMILKTKMFYPPMQGVAPTSFQFPLTTYCKVSDLLYNYVNRDLILTSISSFL